MRRDVARAILEPRPVFQHSKDAQRGQTIGPLDIYRRLRRTVVHDHDLDLRFGLLGPARHLVTFERELTGITVLGEDQREVHADLSSSADAISDVDGPYCAWICNLEVAGVLRS